MILLPPNFEPPAEPAPLCAQLWQRRILDQMERESLFGAMIRVEDLRAACGLPTQSPSTIGIGTAP